MLHLLRKDILPALVDIHAAKVSHNNITPEHLGLRWHKDEPFSVKVADFDHASSFDKPLQVGPYQHCMPDEYFLLDLGQAPKCTDQQDVGLSRSHPE